MEMIWDDFIKREELESAPGVIDQDRIRALTLNTYLTYIRDMVSDGTNVFPDYVAEQLKTVMELVFMDYIHVMEGRSAEPEEIHTYVNDPGNVESLRNMVAVCVNATKESWPKLENQFKELIPAESLERIHWDSKERQENAEKWRKRFESNGFVEL